MRFEETKYNLSALENAGRPIRAEELFNLLVLAMEEALSFSGAVDCAALPCENKSELVQSLKYVLTDTLAAFHANETGLRDLSERTKREMQEANAEAKQTEACLKTLSAQIGQSQTAREQLSRQKRELDQKNGQLLQLQKACDALSAQIAEWNDSLLTDLEARRGRLEAEVNARQSQANTLKAEIKKLQDGLGQSNALLRKAEQDKAKAQAARQKAEARLQETQAAIREANAGRESLTAALQDLEQRHADLLESAARYAQAFNSLHSAVNEPFVCENIFSADGAAFEVPAEGDGMEKTAEIKSAADLQRWMSATQRQIERLISAYEAQLRKIDEASKGLTAPAN